MTWRTPACWALIPVKPPGEGKTRLGGVLDPTARAELVDAMLRRVVEAAVLTPEIRRVYLLSDPVLGSRYGSPVLQDAGGGLNAALGTSIAALPHPAPERIIVVAADLPQVSPADFTMLATVPPRTIAIAPDRHGMGTNALSLPLPAARVFRFQFGDRSYRAHRQEAERLGYRVETMLSGGLEKDIDEPEDLPDAAICLHDAQ